jgi:3-oxoacyl-[acyl-carrier-protein] synthase II
LDKRIVITGIGICSAVGNNVAEVLHSLRSARSGLKPYQCSQAPELNARYAGTIDTFDPETKFAARWIERWDRGTLLAVYAAEEALRASGADLSIWEAQRIGLATGASGSGQFHPTATNPLHGEVIDSSIAKVLLQHNVPSFQTNELARYFGIHGPLTTVASASAGSGIAIGLAMRWLQSGQADFVLAGGGEGLLPLNIIGFDQLGLLDREPCSPFSRSQGMSMGEGSAFVTLERLESALQRGAPILAQLHGFSVTSDAFDAIQFDPSGDGIRRALCNALDDAGLTPEDIDWIKSSGAGGASQDASELAAIESAFGNHRPVVSSLESTYGHTNGAGPAMGLVTSVACVRASLLPATLNFDASQSSNKFDFVPNHPRTQSIKSFAATTAAFGGTNVVLVGGELRPRASADQHDEDPIVISGIGLVTPLGCGTRGIAQELLHSECQWSSLERLGSLLTDVQKVGLVRDFSAKKLLPSLRLRSVDLLTQYAAAATKLALQDAGLANGRMNGRMNGSMNGSMNERLGLVSGISRASGDTLEKLFEALEGPWASLAVSKALLRKGRFLVASQLANWFSCKGFTATITDGLSASLGALLAAVEQLRHAKELQAVVVVAADEVSGSGVRLSEAIGQLAVGQHVAGRPYDPGSHGMIMGEGAVALVLERASELAASNRQAIATIGAVCSTFDAKPAELHGSLDAGKRTLGYPWLEAETSGKWLALAIENSLARAGCLPKDIGTIIGNACGVPAYDERELAALRHIFGREVEVRSVNQHIGVLESACGLLSVAAASLSVQAGCSSNRETTNRATTNRATNLATELPTNALVCATSETGRNMAVVLAACPTQHK